jgi:hypothetical protein
MAVISGDTVIQALRFIAGAADAKLFTWHNTFTSDTRARTVSVDPMGEYPRGAWARGPAYSVARGYSGMPAHMALQGIAAWSGRRALCVAGMMHGRRQIIHNCQGGGAGQLVMRRGSICRGGENLGLGTKMAGSHTAA